MTRYYCTPNCPINITVALGELMDRAPRPYTAGEIAEITGIDLGYIRAFLIRNTKKGKLSVRIAPRRDRSAITRSGKPSREYWRGGQDVAFTFGRGKIITDRQMQDMASGIRPIQWRGSNATVWSLDEAEQVAVRRGNTVVCMGRAEGIALTDGGVQIRIQDGPRLEFEAKHEEG